MTFEELLNSIFRCRFNEGAGQQQQKYKADPFGNGGGYPNLNN
jgi:hypothetical protein